MKRIAINGTSKGLGHALSHQFEALGHEVFGGARTKTEQLSDPPAGHYHPLDVTKSSSQSVWWDRLEAEFGELPDIVLANAATINRNNPLWKVPEDEFRSVVEANVVGVYLTLSEFIRRWQQREQKKPAVLIALSSGWGRSTSPDVAPYCTSKWAVEGMIKALSQELPPGLTALALNPGIINTEMLQSCLGSSAAHYDQPKVWAVRACEQILAAGHGQNGSSETIR